MARAHVRSKNPNRGKKTPRKIGMGSGRWFAEKREKRGHPKRRA
jgi:hypothetical protein